MNPRLGGLCCALTLLTAQLAAANDLLEIFGDVDQSGASLFVDPEAATSGAASRSTGIDVPTATLEITLKGLRNQRGAVHVLAFDDEQAYSRGIAEQAAGYVKSAALADAVTVSLDVYGEGPWAIFAFHDENENERMDMRGPRPGEGYVYSGGVEPGFPPTFDRAARVTGDTSLRLWYLPDGRMRR